MRRAALAFAVVWSAALPVLGVTVPVYVNHVQTTTPSGVVSTSGSDTLVGANGDHVLLMLCVPLVVSLLVAGVLILSRHRVALWLSWALTIALMGGTALSLLTIGIIVWPVPVTLAVACASQPKGASAAVAA